VCQEKRIFFSIAEFPVAGFNWTGELHLQFGFTSRCLQLHIPRRSTCALYSFLLQCPQIFYKTPFVRECLDGKLPLATLKCERRNDLKL
jgi:hypothetical protein